MFSVLTLNKISPSGLDHFDTKTYTWGTEIENPDAIMVRSASMHEMELPKNLKAIARAGAGVNNIPLDKCSENGIVVFNTPGANANAVKELVVAGLLLSSRKIMQGIEWCKTLKGQENVGKLVEKGKSAFTGPEIMGKKLGIIGLGAIGVLVANAAKALGMEVYGYDPYMSVDAAWALSRSIIHAKSLSEIYQNCDYISVHVPLNNETRDMINNLSINSMKDSVRILNFSRGDLVNADDIKEALATGKVATYVTDFPAESLIGVEGVIPIPHLGASTPESEDNCASMAAQEIIAFLEYGSIKNSVNMPEVELGRIDGDRICIIHRNIPNMISQISTVMSEGGVNIEHMVNKSRGDYAYTAIDVSEATDAVIEAIKSIDGVIRVRRIHG